MTWIDVPRVDDDGRASPNSIIYQTVRSSETISGVFFVTFQRSAFPPLQDKLSDFSSANYFQI